MLNMMCLILMLCFTLSLCLTLSDLDFVIHCVVGPWGSCLKCAYISSFICECVQCNVLPENFSRTGIVTPQFVFFVREAYS